MNNKKGFTLIELLVVVLIIGILAAIAVPQYKVAVAKSEYATLKFKTKALAEAINRYRLATGTIPTSKNDLDISVDGYCVFNSPADGGTAECFWKGGQMGFYVSYTALKPQYCYAFQNNAPGNKVCQQETGKTKGSCSQQYCQYTY